MSAHILLIPDFALPFVIETNVSDIAVGKALLQDQESGL